MIALLHSPTLPPKTRMAPRQQDPLPPTLSRQRRSWGITAGHHRLTIYPLHPLYPSPYRDPNPFCPPASSSCCSQSDSHARRCAAPPGCHVTICADFAPHLTPHRPHAPPNPFIIAFSLRGTPGLSNPNLRTPPLSLRSLLHPLLLTPPGLQLSQPPTTLSSSSRPIAPSTSTRFGVWTVYTSLSMPTSPWLPSAFSNPLTEPRTISSISAIPSRLPPRSLHWVREWELILHKLTHRAIDTHREPVSSLAFATDSIFNQVQHSLTQGQPRQVVFDDLLQHLHRYSVSTGVQPPLGLLTIFVVPLGCYFGDFFCVVKEVVARITGS